MKINRKIRNRILHGLLILLASGLHAEPPKQDSPAFTLTAKGPSNRGAFVVGYRFALESDGKITALGLVDQNGDGKLQGTIPVGVALWTPAGQELVRVQIPLSTAATNGVFLVNIPPRSLPVGKYVIGALTEPNGEAFFFDTKVAASPGVVWEEGLFLPSRSLVMPTLSRPQPQSYFGPVFNFIAEGPVRRPAAPTQQLKKDASDPVEKPVVPLALQIESPNERSVIQRNEQNMGRLLVRCTANGESVEVKVVERTHLKTTKDWTALDAEKNSFTKTLDLAAGWYQLEFQVKQGGKIVKTATVQHVGIGDVFVTLGQSNSANYGQPRQAAKSDCVSSCDFRTGLWRHADDPQPGATGGGGSPWPILGDLLVKKAGVPVGFVCLGVGSTGVGQWAPLPSPQGCYVRLKTALQLVGPQGCRAVLWHQGETDSILGTSAEAYAATLGRIITQSREDAGWAVPWGVALASYHPAKGATVERQQAVIAGQKLVIQRQPGVFQGPETDSNHKNGFLADTVHFNADGLTAHAQGWLAALSRQKSPSQPVNKLTVKKLGQ